MTLQFPADPSAQTPENTYSPDSTPLASENGVTYFWDGEKWTATTGNSDDVYLRLDASNDPVTGDVTFQELTTHEAGVSATGGSIRLTGNGTIITETTKSADNYSKGIFAKNTVNGSINYSFFGVESRPTFETVNQTAITAAFGNMWEAATDVSLERYAGFYAGGRIGKTNSNQFNVGFYSSLDLISNPNPGTGTNYNFYAAGEAPNYFPR